jgi:hypothetical protein
MAETYKWLTLNQLVKRGSDGASIPNDPGNKDWKQFQLDGGVATPADPLPTPAAITADARSGAVAQFSSDPSSTAKLTRAILLTIFDEINVIRSLLPGPPAPRTIPQFQAAVQAKINSGAAD